MIKDFAAQALIPSTVMAPAAARGRSRSRILYVDIIRGPTRI